MMRELGKVSSAVILGFLLCLALFSTGAFAQSAGSMTANGAAQGVTTHLWQGANRVAGNLNAARSRGWGNFGWHGRRSGFGFHRFTRMTRVIRVTKLVRVTQVIRVTRVKFIRVTRLIRETQFRHVSSCGDWC